jgi:hypothetical protein
VTLSALHDETALKILSVHVLLSGSLEKLRWWLAEVPGSTSAVKQHMVLAAAGGDVGVLRVVIEELGAELQHALPTARGLVDTAASSGLAAVRYLVSERGQPMPPAAYVEAASVGDLAMVRCLAHELHCPFEEDTLCRVVRDWPPPWKERPAAGCWSRGRWWRAWCASSPWACAPRWQWVSGALAKGGVGGSGGA